MIESDRMTGIANGGRGAADIDGRAKAVFGGLTPRATTTTPVTPSVTRNDLARRARSTAFTTVPVMLTGAIALSLGLTGPIDPAHARKPLPPKPEQSPTPLGLRSALTQIGAALVPGALAAQTASTSAAPAVYTVAAGDTVSSIAQRFGISTASVLALNGLSWKSTIFPGQVLALTTAPVKTTGGAPATTRGGRYTIVKGDTLSAIAARFGIATQSLLDANGLVWSSIVYPGQTIVIPGRVPAPTPAPAPAVGLAADIAVAAPGAGPVESDAPIAGADDGDPQIEAPRAPAVAAMTVVARPVLPVEPRRAPAPRAPGGSTSAPPASPPSGGSVTPLTSEMRTHASTIIQVGRQLGVPEYGIVIALATAMQESSLRNLSWGDRDSVGLFQQRPSSGWGTAADLQVPSHAAKLFYVGRSGYTRGLLDISGWQSMTLTRAAQAVQISAYPNAYAKWEASAWSWYFELT